MPSCDQTGVPIHFHSSTTSGSASLMSLRILPRVSPRQSPSSAILFEMSSEAGWPWLAPDFFIIFLREKRWPSGRRGIATRVALRARPDSHFSMFAKVSCDRFLVYCMDVQVSTYSRYSGPALAGEGQARGVALRPGPRGQHGIQLLQRPVGQSVRARTAVFVGI